VVEVAALASVEGRFNLTCAVSGKKEPNLVARLIPISEKPHTTRPQIFGLNVDRRIRSDYGE
jgi:hypothetical protein